MLLKDFYFSFFLLYEMFPILHMKLIKQSIIVIFSLTTAIQPADHEDSSLKILSIAYVKKISVKWDEHNTKKKHRGRHNIILYSWIWTWGKKFDRLHKLHAKPFYICFVNIFLKFDRTLKPKHWEELFCKRFKHKSQTVQKNFSYHNACLGAFENQCLILYFLGNPSQNDLFSNVLHIMNGQSKAMAVKLISKLSVY